MVCTAYTLRVPADPKGGPAEDVETSQFDNIKVNDPVPEHECYLSHYGLPEPLDVTAPKPPRSWWVVFLGVGVVRSAAAFFAWRRGRGVAAEAAQG